jgi:hypothetical protein
VDLLLALPEVVGPGIFEGLVGAAGFKKGHGTDPVRQEIEIWRSCG